MKLHEPQDFLEMMVSLPQRNAACSCDRAVRAVEYCSTVAKNGEDRPRYRAVASDPDRKDYENERPACC